MFKYILICGLILLSSMYNVNAQENILVYAGPGTGPQSVANTLGMLRALVADKYTVKTVDYADILQNDWTQNTSLLIIPGGADLPYVAKLSGVGNTNIKNYVASGGKFLGICAGAYYAADKIEFYKGDPALEITGERELKFFPGIVSGPTYIGFDDRKTDNTDGIRAAVINWHTDDVMAESELVVYYNGGGHFVAADSYKNIKPLAYHVTPDDALAAKLAAIVECKVGIGKAILSGVHFEWEPQNIDPKSERLALIKQQLSEHNASRLALARQLLTRLDIEVR